MDKKIKQKYKIEEDYYLINRVRPIDSIYDIKNETLIKYLEVLVAIIPKEYLSNMYRNLSTLLIIEGMPNKLILNNKLKLYLDKMILLGKYNPYLNKIQYISQNDYNKMSIDFLGKYDELIKEILPHELLHLCSTKNNYQTPGLTKQKEIKDHCGFSQLINNKLLAASINEGYTQLLTERYFVKDSYSYVFEVHIMSYIEDIIGRDDMYKLYFSADLANLFRKMSKLSSQKETYNFIKAMDDILIKENDITKIKENELKQDLTFIYNYILKIYINKLKKQHLVKDIILDKLVILEEQLITILSDEYFLLMNKDIEITVKIKKK